MPNKQKLYMINESSVVSDYKVLNEATETGSVIIEAVLQTAGVPNRNGRIYPKAILDKGVNAPHIQELINANSWVGEAGHPLNADTVRQVSIDPDRMSHRILSTRWDGNKLIGIVESLNTKNGIEFKNCILQKMRVAFSLRALGATKSTPEGQVVTDPMRMVCYDWVILPSHKEAYMTKVVNGLNESVGVVNGYGQNALVMNPSVVNESSFVEIADADMGSLHESLQESVTKILNESTSIGETSYRLSGDKRSILQENASGKIVKRTSARGAMFLAASRAFKNI